MSKRRNTISEMRTCGCRLSTIVLSAQKMLPTVGAQKLRTFVKFISLSLNTYNIFINHCFWPVGQLRGFEWMNVYIIGMNYYWWIYYWTAIRSKFELIVNNNSSSWKLVSLTLCDVIDLLSCSCYDHLQFDYDLCYGI